MRVLVVDDDLVTRKLVADAVMQLGHEPTVAGTGAEGWQMHCEDAFPIIICDWMMPEMDGLAFCRRVRSSRKAGYSYFILLTAKSSRPDEAIAVESGIDDFLPKPMELETLAARLRVATRILKAEGEIVATNRSLATAEAQYRQLFENQHDGVLVSTENAGITRVNPAAVQMFGMTGETISANGELRLLSSEYLRFREDARQSDAVSWGQFEFRRADGSTFSADVSSSRYPTDDGMTTVTVIRDQSRVARAEQTLRDGEQRFRRLEFLGMVSALAGCGLALAGYFAVGITVAAIVIMGVMFGHLALVVRSREYRASAIRSFAGDGTRAGAETSASDSLRSL